MCGLPSSRVGYRQCSNSAARSTPRPERDVAGRHHSAPPPLGRAWWDGAPGAALRLSDEFIRRKDQRSMLAHGPPVAEVECSLGSKSADALLATGHAPRNDCTNRSRSLQCTLRQNRCVRNRSIAPGLCHPATGSALSVATADFHTSFALITRANRSCSMSRSPSDSDAITRSLTAKMAGCSRSYSSNPDGVRQ